MPAIETALAAAKYAPLVKKGWDWLTGKKKKVPGRQASPLEQNYVNFLQSQAKQGIDPAQQNLMMGAAGRGAAQGVNQMSAGIMNRGVMQGLEGSAVMSQQLAAADSVGAGQLAQTAREIAFKNFQVKQTAQDKLGGIGQMRSNANWTTAKQQFDFDNQRESNTMSQISTIASDFLTKKKNKDILTDLKDSGYDLKDLPPEILIQIMGG